MFCSIFNNKYFHISVYYYYLLLPSPWTVLLPSWTVLIAFLIIITCIYLPYHLLGWFYLCFYVCFYLHITFNLYYCNITVLPLPTLCPLPSFMVSEPFFLVGDSVVRFSVSPSVSTRNFDTPLLCDLLTVVGVTLVVK